MTADVAVRFCKRHKLHGIFTLLSTRASTFESHRSELTVKHEMTLRLTYHYLGSPRAPDLIQEVSLDRDVGMEEGRAQNYDLRNDEWI